MLTRLKGIVPKVITVIKSAKFFSNEKPRCGQCLNLNRKSPASPARRIPARPARKTPHRTPAMPSDHWLSAVVEPVETIG